MGGHTSPALTGPPEAGGRLIGGAGAVAPAGRPKADLWPMFPHWEKLFSEKYPKIRNVDFGGENQSCSRRNSAHFGTHTVSWGPLNDHFPGFYNFVEIGVPGSIPRVCFFLGFSGAAQSFFRGKNRPFPKLNRGTLDFYHFLTIFNDFL